MLRRLSAIFPVFLIIILELLLWKSPDIANVKTKKNKQKNLKGTNNYNNDNINSARDLNLAFLTIGVSTNQIFS